VAAVSADFKAPDPTALWQLGVDTGRAYAAVSGDFNPIHLSVLSAKALGMRRSIAHGMYLASRALADVGAVKR
jgi:acyl dehydratase